MAHIHRIGPSGGFNAALLVGRVCDDSHRVCKLVGGISKRLVLGGKRDADLAAEKIGADENYRDKSRRWDEVGRSTIPPSVFPNWNASCIGKLVEPRTAGPVQKIKSETRVTSRLICGPWNLFLAARPMEVEMT